MLLHDLQSRGLIHPPNWLPDNCQYLCLMGSVAYGVSSDTSDCDIYGLAIPTKSIVFPHLDGFIDGFGTGPQRFDIWQQHHVRDKESKKEYDFAVYGIVKFFTLCMDNNPNMVDALFVPLNCIIHNTQVAQMVRESRHLFLHKGCWHRFKGYCFQQLNKAENRIHKGLDAVIEAENNLSIPHSVRFLEVLGEAKYRGLEIPKVKFTVPVEINKVNAFQCDVLKDLSNDAFLEYMAKYTDMMISSARGERVKIDGMDSKFLYHVVRLLDEAEQILTTGDLDLQRAKEQMKAVRRGEMSEQDVREYFNSKEKDLEKVYENSKLPYSADESKIKSLLLNCLEHYYGSLDKCVVEPNAAVNVLRQIQEIIEKNSRVLQG